MTNWHGILLTDGPDDLFFGAGRGSALITNGGDNATVYDPTNAEFVQATFNGDPLDDPTLGVGGYAGFSNAATQIGSGEHFGSDIDGRSVQRAGDGADMFITDAPTPGTTNVCFADDTFLATPHGKQPREQLRPGDYILTADRGAQQISWTYSKTWTPG